MIGRCEKGVERGPSSAYRTGLADVLGIERWHTVIGGSMGGMRTLEWVASHPERVGT